MLTGLVAGRYRLLGMLGEGGMGQVWRAHDEVLRVDVAMKAVRLPDGVTGPARAELVVRAAREARHAARLRECPHVVTLHDVVVEQDLPWTVMQLVDGVSLAEHLRTDGPLTVERAIDVADAVLRALEAAHDAGIVHRDVKPANIMLAGDRVLLTDFGIALHQNDTVLTADGVLVGTPEYMAPERAEGTTEQTAGDLFSLGATLYHALEGCSPFRRDGLWDTVAALIGHDPPVPRRAGPLRPLLAALLNKDPRLRPTAAGALTLLPKSGRLNAYLPPVPAPPEPGGTSQIPPAAHTQESSAHVTPVPEGQRAVAEALTNAARIARSLAGGNSAEATTRIAELLKHVDPLRVDTLVEEAVRLLPPHGGGDQAAPAAETVTSTVQRSAAAPRRHQRNTTTAERRARDHRSPRERATALAQLARQVAVTDPQRAEGLLVDAEEAVLSIRLPWRQTAPRTEIAGAWARTAQSFARDHPQHAERLVNTALHIVHTLPSGTDTGRALTASIHALYALALASAASAPDRAALLLGKAQRAASTLPASRAIRALVDKALCQAHIARELAETRPAQAQRFFTDAQQTCGRITDDALRSKTQDDIAAVLFDCLTPLTAFDPDWTERKVGRLRDARQRSQAQEHIVQALVDTLGGAAAGDPDRAQAITMRALRIIGRISSPAHRARAVEALTTALATSTTRVQPAEMDWIVGQLGSLPEHAQVRLWIHIARARLAHTDAEDS